MAPHLLISSERSGLLRHGDYVDEGVSHLEARPTTKPPAMFEEFFEVERARLFATLVMILADRTDAEETMQESFVRVWERWDRVQNHPDPTGYLYRTAMNLVRQRRRRLRLARRTADAPSMPADAFSAIEDRHDLVVALRTLTPRQRAAIVLTELMDIEVAEVARMLHVRPGTIRSLCSQGRQRIRLMGGEEP
jgi:RNA polymerase sigma factor (sigma-70 family)